MIELNDIENELYDFAHAHMVPDILHGWPHIERVLFYAEQINEEIKGEWQIIKSAVLLHDIGHSIQRKNHNHVSAQLAEDFLATKKIEQVLIQHISDCIITHSRQFSHSLPVSVEAKVVYDADGMDLFGPIGLMRALLSCGLRGKGFECMIKRLEWRLGEKENFYSTTASRFAKDNSRIIEEYLFQLQRQLNQVTK